MQTAIVGGGAAGFFLAVNLKEMMPEMGVTIFERSQRVLAKVAVSGGGRCNCTNSFADVGDLSAVYPRGHRLMKRLFNVFDHRAAFAWFEAHGVPLVTQADQCVFPAAQDARAIIDCLRSEAQRHGVVVHLGARIDNLDDLRDYDYVCVTTGGQPTARGLQWLSQAGHETEPPVPSLFSLRVADERLTALMGTVAPDATAHLAGTKHRGRGALLVTHWGVSGPAVLKVSSYGARTLADAAYRWPLSINWLSLTDADTLSALRETALRHASKQLTTLNPFGLPQRLWAYLVQKAMGHGHQKRWGEVSQKELNRLTNVVVNDSYTVSGRAPFRDEFVTCGGISLRSVHPSTLESRHVPRLFFAGEVLDIDGITGGFNFQAAWTTAYVVATAITRQSHLEAPNARTPHPIPNT